MLLYNKAMRLLGRKRKDEDEINEPSEGKEKPKRTRKKKEEVKPWGKVERVLVFGVLFLTILVSVVLALNARSWKLPGFPRLELTKGVLQQTYVFEGKPPTRDTQKILDAVDELTRDASGVYGFYVINLNTEETYGENIDEIFQAASLIKLPIMTALYSEYEKGNIDLDDVYILKDADKVGGYGSIVYQDAGRQYSYRELVEHMGRESDNTAFNASVQLLGEDFVREYISQIGLEHTSYDDNETTPRDIGMFFRKLWQRKLVDRSSRDEILKYLTNTIYEDWIGKGITDVRVAHKFGREVHVVNDAGIVFGESPYVLVIMSKGVVEPEADEIIPEIASLVHRFESEGN